MTSKMLGRTGARDPGGRLRGDALDCGQAAQLAPDSSQAHAALAKALDAKGLHQEAQEEMRRAGALNR